MPYITTTDIQNLGYDLTGVDVEGICLRAVGMVDGEIGQSVEPTLTLEAVSVYRSGRMLAVIPNYLPVISIEYIRMYRGDLTTVDVTSGFMFTDGGVILFPAVPVDLSLPAALKYQHGYSQVPADIKQAALIVADALLNAQKTTTMAGIGGVKSISDGGRSVSIGGAVIELPQAAKDLLAKYRRVR